MAPRSEESMVGARPRFRVRIGGGQVLGPGLREPAWRSFGAWLVGRLSRPFPITRPPPPVRLQLGMCKGKSKATAQRSSAGHRQRHGKGGEGGVGWGYDGSPSVLGE